MEHKLIRVSAKVSEISLEREHSRYSDIGIFLYVDYLDCV